MFPPMIDICLSLVGKPGSAFIASATFVKGPIMETASFSSATISA